MMKTITIILCILLTHQHLFCSAANNTATSGELPVVHILRVTSVPNQDFGVYAAVEMFHTSSRYNDRFRVQLHQFSTGREVLASIGTTLRIVVDALAAHNKFAYVAFFGPDYSSEAVVVSQITPVYQLVNIAANAVNAFTNADNFPLYFRATTTTNAFNRALMALVKYLDIRRVNTLSTTEAFSLDRVNNFARLFTSQKQQHADATANTTTGYVPEFSTVEESVVIDNNGDVQFSAHRLIDTFRTRDANSSTAYVVGNFYDLMPYVACEFGRAIDAGRARRTAEDEAALSIKPYPTFFVMEHVDTRDPWAPVPNVKLNCTLEMVDKYLNGSIAVQISNAEYKVRPEEAQLYNSSIIAAVNEKQRLMFNGTVTLRGNSYLAYDMAWAMLTALYRVDERLEREKSGRRIFNFLPTDGRRSLNNSVIYENFAKLLHDELLHNTVFTGITGKFKFNSVQDRYGILGLLQFQGSRRVIFGSYDEETDAVAINASRLVFATPTGEAPHVWRRRLITQQLAAPNGGGRGASQSTITTIIIVAVVGVVAIVTAAVIVWKYRTLWSTRGQNDTSWLLLSTDFKTTYETDNRDRTSSTTQRSLSSSASAVFASFGHFSTTTLSGRQHQQLNLWHFYKNARVHIHGLPRGTVVMGSATLFSAMQNLDNDNVNRFIGVCLDFIPANDPTTVTTGDSSTAAVFAHQERGTVRTLLQNTEVIMDTDITASYIGECFNGLRALHEANIAHGFLHTGDVMLDSRLTCKITDYGLGGLRAVECGKPLDINRPHDDEDDDKKLLFQSPEQLRDGYIDSNAKRCDVYSMGLVVAEIVTQEAPSFATTKPMTSSEILEQQLLVANGVVEPLQLQLQGSAAENSSSSKFAQALRPLIDDCLSPAHPERRPSAQEAQKRFTQILSRLGMTGKSSSLAEKLAQRLQNYTSNLQSLVDERTRALVEETRRSEQLLLQLLPPSVCAELKAGRRVEPELFECVSIHYSDIVGFTALSARATPMQIVELLNALYTAFDNVVGRHHTYKVETIGDAYIVVSGLPERIPRHGHEICNFSLDVVETLQTFQIPHDDDGTTTPTASRLKMRIGLHCGPAAAGVVGIRMPRYCLFGSTVLEANRMESTGEPMRIHCSLQFYDFMKQHQQETTRQNSHRHADNNNNKYTFEWIPAKKDSAGLTTSYWLEKIPCGEMLLV